MDIHYLKNDNSSLFADFNNPALVNVKSLQNYVPLYNKFFSLNDTNYNNINLNHRFNITNITEKFSENKYHCSLNDRTTNNNENNKPVFFKLSPLFDPIKFMIGKYDDNSGFLTLPDYKKKHDQKKLDDENNSSYVDSFFSYLTSRFLHEYNFIHGTDFYGSFLGIKNNYKVNIADDIEYLQDSSYFNTNNNISVNNITFSLDSAYLLHDSEKHSRTKKEKINLMNDSTTILNLSDISDLKEFDTIFTNSDVQSSSSENLDLMFECKNLAKPKTSSSSETCSSRSSNTDSDGKSNSQSSSSSENRSNTSSHSSSSYTSHGSGSSYSSTASEEQIMINISEFPIQLIALEQCEETLDHYLSQNKFSDSEWDSMVIQVLMILITYQNVFDLTHNDLHTNNIMYNTTDKVFITYRLNGKYYKVPSFGRIYKIIDYGRAIYKFKGKQLCSDSFHPKGDAATQYNFEPYYDPKKPILHPNKSFDLCRLGCSLFDFIIEELEEDNKISNLKDIKSLPNSIKKIILDWCHDDKGRNVIYKNNGDERYPEFKLYKMISRTVNKHTPHNVIKNAYFDKYIVSKKKVNMKKMLDIDSYPNLQ
jgi:hypothetical protein